MSKEKVYDIYFTSKEYKKLFAIQTKPEHKVWFKDKETSIGEFIDLLIDIPSSKTKHKLKELSNEEVTKDRSNAYGFLNLEGKTADEIRFEKFNLEWEENKLKQVGDKLITDANIISNFNLDKGVIKDENPYYSSIKNTEEMKKYQSTIDRVKRIKELNIKQEFFISTYVKNDEPIKAVDFQKVIKYIKNNPTITIDIDVFIKYINELIEKYKAYNPNTTLIEIVNITGVVNAPYDDMYIRLSDGGYLSEKTPVFVATDTRVGMISHEALQPNSEVIEQSKEEIELDVLKRYMKFHNENNSYENIYIEDVETFLKTQNNE